MDNLFNLDISSVEIVNEPKNKVSRTSRLNESIERFSKLIKRYTDGSDVYDELLLVFKAIKIYGDHLQDTYVLSFAIKLDNGWYRVKKDDPGHRYEDTPWVHYIREHITRDIISTNDRLELDELIEVYRKKCKTDSINDFFNNTGTNDNTENV